MSNGGDKLSVFSGTSVPETIPETESVMTASSAIPKGIERFQRIVRLATVGLDVENRELSSPPSSSTPMISKKKGEGGGGRGDRRMIWKLAATKINRPINLSLFHSDTVMEMR